MYEPTYKLERKVRYGSESAKKEIKRRQGNYGDVFVGNEYKIIHTPCNVEDIQLNRR